MVILGSTISESIKAVTAPTNNVTLAKKIADFTFSIGKALCSALKNAELKKIIKIAVHNNVNLVEFICQEKNWLEFLSSIVVGVKDLRNSAIKTSES
ncbi:hypothetical protein GCM10011613_04690 [Cellvibrio zantedeschiae]|uniref:Four helix bundle protein n=1 Tax=Cellvibrio zantedeschiae TaxID=1237077 RepID=A0ABQ3ARR3_9GAMM|nr:hypothetical protein GCM10011613_04690 [Cellvibrio zantedeschiae]